MSWTKSLGVWNIPQLTDQRDNTFSASYPNLDRQIPNVKDMPERHHSAPISRRSFYEDLRIQKGSLSIQILFRKLQTSAKNRVKTYENWPHTKSPLSVSQLANTGFYSTQRMDEIRCVFCYCTLRNIQSEHELLIEHKQASPDCLAADRTQQYNNRIYREKARPVAEQTCPRKPLFEDEEARLVTFYNWPKDKEQTPESLAAAGFFYTENPEVPDEVHCFYCSLRVFELEANEEPWQEHARWNPECEWLIKQKGDKYIQSILDLYHPKYSESMQDCQPNDEHITARYKFDSRDISHRMDTELCLAIFKMGFQKKLVRDVIEKQLKMKGNDFENAEALMLALFKAREDLGLPRVPSAEEKQQRNSAHQVNLTVSGRDQGVTSGQTILNEQNETSRNISSVGANQHSNETKREKTKAWDSDDEEERCEIARQVLAKSSDKDARMLLAKNLELRRNEICMMCQSEENGVVFLPCGHLVSCPMCAPALRLCPLCSTSIGATVRAYKG